MQVILKVINGTNQGQEYCFDEPSKFLVGRSPEAHFCLSNKDLYVSRRHFLLEIMPAAYSILAKPMRPW
ncbi:hypothetical protein ACFL4L_04000 [bacterium]